MLVRHVSDLTGPSSGAFLQAVFADLVCGTTVRTTRHVQPLQSCRKTSYNLVSAGRVESYMYYHIPNLQIQLVKTLLMMDR